MKQDTFVSRHEKSWQEFEAWLESVDDKRVKRDEAPHISLDIPHLYRRICHHLALARERRYSAHLVVRLNTLVMRGHQRLYQVRRRGWYGLSRFLFVEFPRKVRQEWRLVLISGLLFYGPMLGIIAATQVKPEIIYSVMAPAQVAQFEAMYNPENRKIGRKVWERGSDDDFLMFGHYIRNNIGIGFQTFAGGILFCIGSIFYLFFNGLFIGAVTGHLIQVGYQETFFTFVAGHSALELTAILLAGAAGMRLGLAILKPGRRTRVRALKESAIGSMPIVYGLALMLVGAAFIEAFWSSTSGFEPNVKYTVGIINWTIVLLYFVFAGRGYED